MGDDDRISFQEGNVDHPEICCSIDLVASLPRPLVVIEDANHTERSTSTILNYFGPLMLPGEYIIVEDSLQNWMSGDDAVYRGGPKAAIEKFLVSNDEEWGVDRAYCDFFGRNTTWSANGYLRRKGASVVRKDLFRRDGTKWYLAE
jgi:cephalosporin hydroxylase